ncbi:MAG: hypothetical protein ACI4EQ_04495 [Lachnospiraceae bacterium]
MQPEYTKVKVHNEIELCETADMEVKQQIERVLLHNRISYYIKWHKQGFFKRNKNVCIFCINDNSREEAERLVRSISKDIESKVHFLLRKFGESYF